MFTVWGLNLDPRALQSLDNSSSSMQHLYGLYSAEQAFDGGFVWACFHRGFVDGPQGFA